MTATPDNHAEPENGHRTACIHCGMTIEWETTLGEWRHALSRLRKCDDLPPVGWGAQQR